jgi:protein-tyrosine-phosphatase
MPTETPERILIVGIDDVCAAPLVAALLRAGLAEDRPDVEIVSAGIEATTGEPVCSATAVRGAPLDDLRSHRSVPLHAEQIRRTDLVIVMDRDQRARVNRMQPGRQRSVFTLREAVTLALRDGADAWAGTETVAEFAEELHSRRGLVKPRRLSVPRRGLLRRPVALLAADDLLDGHLLDNSAHAWAVGQTRTAALALATALRGRRVRQPVAA